MLAQKAYQSVVKEKGNKFNYKNYQIKVGDAKCLE
jgi:hypothetical protein